MPLQGFQRVADNLPNISLSSLSICSHSMVHSLQGFQRVVDNLPDISLDNPAARERFDAAIKAARAGKPPCLAGTSRYTI